KRSRMGWQYSLAVLPFSVVDRGSARACVERACARQSILPPRDGILESCPALACIRRFENASYVNRINFSNSSEFEKLLPETKRSASVRGHSGIWPVVPS